MGRIIIISLIIILLCLVIYYLIKILNKMELNATATQNRNHYDSTMFTYKETTTDVTVSEPEEDKKSYKKI